MAIQIPDKTYFKIGEVARLLDLQPYVLRYWETEFDALRPEKTKSGQRAYRREDIELLVLVKTLLYEEMYTIAGARRQLKLRKRGAIEPLGPEAQQRLVSDHDALMGQKGEWIEERQRLNAASETHRGEAGRLRVHSDTLETENAGLAAAQIDYEDSIGRLRDEISQRVEIVSHLEDSNRLLEAKVAKLAEGASAQAVQLDLSVQQSENVERIAALESERDDVSRAADALSGDLAGQVARVQDLEEALAASSAAAELSAAELRRLAEEMEALEADFASAESELERLEAEKEALATQAVDSAEVEALEARLAEALTSIESLHSSRDGLAERRAEHGEQQRARYVMLRSELESLVALVN